MSELNFSPEVEKILDEIIEEYDRIFQNVQGEALKDPESRAYGGVIRSTVGGFVEWMTKRLVVATWLALGKSQDSLNFKSGKHKLPILQEYVDNIEIPEVKKHIQNNISGYTYGIGQDVHVYEGADFILSIECEAYAENAMLKRIIVDCWFLQKLFPTLKFALIQLESQLTGDYHELNEITFGSKSSHTIISYFDVDLQIITLLKGVRKVKEPIHKKEFYKPLKKEKLKQAVNLLSELLI